MTDHILQRSDPVERRALVVDLDQTLSRTDTLHEALIRLIVRRPWAVFGLLGPLLRGKPAFKARVADQSIVQPDDLPLNDAVLDAIAVARADGREVALVSASDHRQVVAISSSLGIFDAAFGTGSPDLPDQNLGGAAKASFLEARYGARGFDYIGDSAKDVPVWSKAAQSITVNPSTGLQRQAKVQNIDLISLPGAASRPASPDHTKALRPHQWVKNILVFLPMFAAQDLSGWPLALMAFLLFSLIASAVYVLNDLVDLPSDRAHPRKRLRPFAAGRVPISHGVVMAALLILVAAGFSIWLMPLGFTLVLAAYFAATLAYSFYLKSKLLIDVITLAGLYTMRIIAGAAATGITPSPWLLAFSVFLFYALATVKRWAEILDRAAQGDEASPGRGYTASDASVLQMISISSGMAAVLVFALYLDSSTATELYAQPAVLWLICPVLLYWLSRIAAMTQRGHMHDDPIIFAAKDKISYATAAVVAVIVLVAERGW